MVSVITVIRQHAQQAMHDDRRGIPDVSHERA